MTTAVVPRKFNRFFGAGWNIPANATGATQQAVFSERVDVPFPVKSIKTELYVDYGFGEDVKGADYTSPQDATIRFCVLRSSFDHGNELACCSTRKDPGTYETVFQEPIMVSGVHEFQVLDMDKAPLTSIPGQNVNIGVAMTFSNV